MHHANTVEPLYNGQVGAGVFCPLYGGVLYREGPVYLLILVIMNINEAVALLWTRSPHLKQLQTMQVTI